MKITIEKQKKVVYKVVSDNFKGLLSPVAYRQLTLSMSSGDFGSHKKEILRLDNFELGCLMRMKQLRFVELFNEEWEPTTLGREYAEIVEQLTFKQYCKLMGGSMKFLDKLVRIKKVTKNKLILDKLAFLLDAHKSTGFQVVGLDESIGA